MFKLDKAYLSVIPIHSECVAMERGTRTTIFLREPKNFAVVVPNRRRGSYWHRDSLRTCQVTMSIVVPIMTMP